VTEQAALSFGGMLRQLRAEARLTQEELAAAAKVSPRSVSDLERGINRTARKDTAELLANALGLAGSVRELFVAAARGRASAAEVLAAMRGEASAVASAGPAPGRDPVWAGCPYLGLVPFQERDERVFYGRGELVAQLVHRLARQLGGTGILLVAGESGAGKSSLLRAGLMPLLAAGALGPGSDRWPRQVIQPTGSPLRELAMQLADIAGADPVSVYQSLSAAPGEAPMLVEHTVRAATGRATNPGQGASADAAAPAPPRLVLVVDQFEELFTTGADGKSGRVEREGFITALHAAATVPAGPHKRAPAVVVAVVRVDFLGQLIAYPPLKAALDAGLFTVGPMSEAELRLAVTGPAAEAGLAVEPALVEAVLAELREGTEGGLGSGVLPLMSQAMAATWERREGSGLTLRAYRHAGGVADAVNRGAQAAYDALTGRQQDAARLVFTQLTAITPNGQFARRRCSRTDLRSPGAKTAEDIDAVIDIFSAHRLLVLGKDGIEISHDVLLQAWKQLRDWLEDDQFDRVLYSQVATDAQIWDINRRDSSYLYRPGRLATVDAAAVRWQDASTRYPPLSATTKAFLRAAHHAAARSTRRRRAGIAGLLALTVIAISAAGIAAHNAASATRQHAIAVSRQLAGESLALASTDFVTAGRLAVAAWRVFPTDQARSAMTALLADRHPDAVLPGNPPVTGVAFSPNGKLLAAALMAAAAGQGAVQPWDPAIDQAVGVPLPANTGREGGVNGVAFSPDGRLLAIANGDGTARIWDLATGRAVGAPILASMGSTAGVTGVAFSSDGKLLATADSDGIVRLWDLATRQLIRSLLSGTLHGVNGVAFSPDGKLLATANSDGTVRLWDRATGRAVGVPLPANTGPAGGVNAVAFSPDGKLLATADADGAVRLWNRATGRAVGVPLPANTGPAGGVNAVAFSPDGKLLATADADGSVRTWHMSLLANPYTALCVAVGPPTREIWTRYAPGEPQPSVCGEA
jgi:DNA-binding beta-propeller fold protein YncE/transcriptional regulator with XRE-family HTH domain